MKTDFGDINKRIEALLGAPPQGEEAVKPGAVLEPNFASYKSKPQPEDKPTNMKTTRKEVITTWADIGKMSDDQLVKHYHKYIARNNHNVAQAGMAAGELARRGYDIIEEPGVPEQFVKKEQKVA